MVLTVQRVVAIVAINPIAKRSTDSAQRDVLLDIGDSFVLSVSTMHILSIFNFLMHV